MKKRIKKLKVLVLLPVLLIPIITFCFWFISGGKLTKHTISDNSGKFNLKLPPAVTNHENPTDKMSFYKKAELEDHKWEELTQTDPYYNEVKDQDSNTAIKESNSSRVLDSNNSLTQLNKNPKHPSSNEEKINHRIEQIQRVINDSTDLSTTSDSNTIKYAEIPSTNIHRLEQMMLQMNNSEEVDPELKQLDQMLQSVLDIQHPDRVRQRIKENSLKRKGQVFTVATTISKPTITNLTHDKNTIDKENYGFYGLEEFKDSPLVQNAIRVFINEDQIIINGTTIKLCLDQDIFIQGICIPKGNFVYGKTSLNKDRLDIQIESIRFENSLFPVKLTAYSMDGIRGMLIPGTISREVTKQSSASTLQGLGSNTFDTSIGAQLASAGIETTKTLLGKKAKLIRVKVKAGDKLLLKDENQKI